MTTENLGEPLAELTRDEEVSAKRGERSGHLSYWESPLTTNISVR